MTKQTKRGGLRNPPGGRPPNPNKRIKISATLAPGIQELCQAIAKERGYKGQWYAVDEAIKKLAQEMGLT